MEHDWNLTYALGHDAATVIPTFCHKCGVANEHVLTISQRRVHPHFLMLPCPRCQIPTQHSARKR